MDGGHATSPHTALDSSALRCFFLYPELKINAPNNTILSFSAFILAAVLVRELKKVDDKELIFDVQLEENKAYYHLSNRTKARASLASARAVANSKYVPPKTQVSGILAYMTVKFVNLRLLLTCNQEFFTQPMKRTSKLHFPTSMYRLRATIQ